MVGAESDCPQCKTRQNLTNLTNLWWIFALWTCRKLVILTKFSVTSSAPGVVRFSTDKTTSPPRQYESQSMGQSQKYPASQNIKEKLFFDNGFSFSPTITNNIITLTPHQVVMVLHFKAKCKRSVHSWAPNKLQEKCFLTMHFPLVPVNFFKCCLFVLTGFKPVRFF